ncbi:MAG: S26 family signal peptidase [Acidimicrobiales bacterium]
MRRLVHLVARRVEVEGLSMTPTYRPGERVLVVRRWRPVRPGDVVLARDPRDPHRWLLKRCLARRGDAVDLRGDNAAVSTDSRDFGDVSSRAIGWLVVRPRRARLLG